MNRYTIYCTEEQTKKARELGAPIEIKSIEEAPKDWQGKAFFTGMSTCAKLSTAEQMLNWLEEQGLFVGTQRIKNADKTFTYYYNISDNDCENINNGMWMYKTNKEATLAAIDAALEYLIKEKTK